MKQVVVGRDGIQVVEVPAPSVRPGTVRINVSYSAISSGTELSAVRAEERSLASRIAHQPVLVREGLRMLKEQGLSATLNAAVGRYRPPSALGYSISGIVEEIAPGAPAFNVGDTVAAAGFQFAHHAAYVVVPENLVVHRPKHVTAPEAATVALGAVSLHAIRRAEIRLGEFIAVVGVGVLGQLAAQLAATSGARVICIDRDQRRLDLARELGASWVFNPLTSDVTREVQLLTNGMGVDSVIFAAQTSDPSVLSGALQLCRRKGRLVMIGEYGSTVNRGDLYEREIDFLPSCSYGPGRYDPAYEEGGFDYPYAYVRWTEKRNMEEYLRLVGSKAINLRPLIEKVYAVDEAPQAFEALSQPDDRPVIVLLKYSEEESSEAPSTVMQIAGSSLHLKSIKDSETTIRVGVIGTGEFARRYHLPNLQLLRNNLAVRALCARDGTRLVALAKQYDVSFVTTDSAKILESPEIDAVILCTRHNLHAELVISALKAGKHTFVEKPLCLNLSELSRIEEVYNSLSEKPVLIVGYNRRFSPLSASIREHVSQRSRPLLVRYRMNAGYLPPSHWVHSAEGGGRIIGEACHILDVFRYLVGFPLESMTVHEIAMPSSRSDSEDKVLVCRYEDGSVAVLEYFSFGSSDLAKEWGEFHFDGKSIFLDNYERIIWSGLDGPSKRYRQPQKGHLEELNAFASTIRGECENPISFSSLVETSRASILAAQPSRADLRSDSLVFKS